MGVVPSKRGVTYNYYSLTFHYMENEHIQTILNH